MMRTNTGRMRAFSHACTLTSNTSNDGSINKNYHRENCGRARLTFDCSKLVACGGGLRPMFVPQEIEMVHTQGRDSYHIITHCCFCIVEKRSDEKQKNANRVFIYMHLCIHVYACTGHSTIWQPQYDIYNKHYQCF
jgi:hypothetical protein